jgi:putative phosphoribosyl transferase
LTAGATKLSFEDGMQVFRNRREAGRDLASKLQSYANRPDVVVLGLPRGGVPVAFEVAQALHVPLDVYMVRKLGVPGNEELAMGAVASGGHVVINSDVVATLRIPNEIMEAVAVRESADIARRERLYRGDRRPPDVAGKIIILVDDGVATGSTIVAAATALRSLGAARIVIATPVVAATSLPALQSAADEVVWVHAPHWFVAVGQWYLDFSPTIDEEVRALLEGDDAGRPHATAIPETVVIRLHDVSLFGDLTVFDQPTGVVLFAHGAGSGRKSPRNRFVANVLQRAGFATLLLDLLTEAEEVSERYTAHLRFDVDLLAQRLLGATEWIANQDSTGHLPIGYFGASTGAAAALIAAAENPDRIGAVVSRGGRPDLARSSLSRVKTPTLLIVGGNDPLVLDLNRRALRELRSEKLLEIVPGASHLFDEPGALERVAEVATEWFADQLPVLTSGEPAASSPLTDEPSAPQVHH